MTALLGPKRRPMLVVDARSTVRDRRSFNARAAGVLGMSTFGRDHLYALDDDMRLQIDLVREWLDRHEGEPLLVFGFTFMVWKYFVQAAADEGLDLSHAVLVHSGGWKRLQDEAVSSTQFADRLRAGFGIERVANFYGMVEQIGTVFLECAHGRLHAPNAAEVVVRDPETWAPVDDGRPGVIQVLSGLPTSYPGHSILTEDLGAIVSRDTVAVAGSGPPSRSTGGYRAPSCAAAAMCMRRWRREPRGAATGARPRAGRARRGAPAARPGADARAVRRAGPCRL